MCPFFPASEATLTIAPRLFEAIVERAASRDMSSATNKLTRKIFSQSAQFVSSGSAWTTIAAE